MAKFKVGDRVVITNEGGGEIIMHYHPIKTRCLILEDRGDGVFRLQVEGGTRKQYVDARCFRHLSKTSFTNK